VKRRLPVRTALVGLLIAPAALAQQGPQQQPADPPKPDPNPQPPNESTPAQPSGAPATMQTVTVTGARPSDDFAPPVAPALQRVGSDIMDVPQSVIVINKALMQSQGATSLTSAVRNVPGVTIGAAEGGQIGNNINLNGFSARTDLYIDGMRDPGQYYRDTFDLEQIEILMGPSSMLFGRGSTGGVINQVLKKPSLKDAIELSVAATTNGLVRSTADVNKRTGEAEAFRMNAMFQEGRVSTRNQTDVLDFGLAPSYKLGIGQPTTVTLYALLQHNHDKVDYGLPPLNGYPAQVNPNNAYGFNSDFTNQDVIMLGSTVEHKFDKNATLRNQTQFNYVNTYAIETAPNTIGTVSQSGVFTPVPTYNGAPATFTLQPLTNLFVRQQSHDRNIFDTSIDNQTELSWKFDTGPIRHDTLWGIDLGYENYYNQNYFRNGSCNGQPLVQTAATTGFVNCTSLAFPGSGANSPANVPEQVGNLATGLAKWAGFYVNDNITVIPELKLVGGVRQDIYYSQAWNTINAANTAGANMPLAYAEQTVNFTSVRGGVIFEPTHEQSYYVSYSTSFNPSLEQLVSTTGTSQDLPPENNESWEAGVKYLLFKENLALTGALFQITKYNARTQNPDNTFSATGTIQVKGVRTGVAGRITPEWQVFGGYSYLDGRIINGIAAGTTGMVPLNTPRDSANLWTTYTFHETYEIGGGATYLGWRYANNQNTVVVPPFTRFDMTAAYKQPKYDVRLNIFNLLNTTYYDQIIASDGGRVVPGSGLTAMLTLNYRM
jgi:catecholate siderophore receptor